MLVTVLKFNNEFRDNIIIDFVKITVLTWSRDQQKYDMVNRDLHIDRAVSNKSMSK